MGIKIRTTPGITLKDERICVLHDDRGEIFHIHHHASLHTSLRNERVEEAAREAASAADPRRPRDQLRALMVQPVDFDPRKRYRVDVRTRRLEEVRADGAPFAGPGG